MPEPGRTPSPFPHRCAGCGVPITEWDDEYGYVWDQRGFATCGESDTAHHLPVKGRTPSGEALDVDGYYADAVKREEERQKQAAEGRTPSRETAYRHLTQEGATTGLLACERCGAIVHKTSLRTHTEWHAKERHA